MSVPTITGVRLSDPGAGPLLVLGLADGDDAVVNPARPCWPSAST